MRFGRILNVLFFKGGFTINVLTFFRIGYMLSGDKDGKFIQFNVGFWVFDVILQFALNKQ